MFIYSLFEMIKSPAFWRGFNRGLSFGMCLGCLAAVPFFIVDGEYIYAFLYFIASALNAFVWIKYK